MIFRASVLDLSTSSATSRVFLTAASNAFLANSACLAAASCGLSSLKSRTIALVSRIASSTISLCFIARDLAPSDAASADRASASIFFRWASISFSVSSCGNLRSSASFVNMLVKDCHCSAMVSSNACTVRIKADLAPGFKGSLAYPVVKTQHACKFGCRRTPLSDTFLRGAAYRVGKRAVAVEPQKLADTKSPVSWGRAVRMEADRGRAIFERPGCRLAGSGRSMGEEPQRARQSDHGIRRVQQVDQSSREPVGRHEELVGRGHGPLSRQPESAEPGGNDEHRRAAAGDRGTPRSDPCLVAALGGRRAVRRRACKREAAANEASPRSRREAMTATGEIEAF